MLNNKKILITGIANKFSIANGIAQSMSKNGAELAFAYQNERLLKKIKPIADDLGVKTLIECDVACDKSIEKTFSQLADEWGTLDGIVHSIGFAPSDQLDGDFTEVTTREGFQIAHDISSYSFAGLIKEAHPFMSENSSVVTLTYIGSQEATPNYNVMGMAKASLEAGVRYFASSLGKKGVRVNSISAGPIKTLAASGIKGFKSMLSKYGEETPLGRNISAEEVGNTATFLLSDMSSGITGQTIYVDGGYNIQATKFE